MKSLLNTVSTKTKRIIYKGFGFLSLISKRVVPNYLSATNPVPPGNDLQCGWEGRTGYACSDEAPRKQLGMLKRMLLGNFLEQGDASQFQSSNISW